MKDLDIDDYEELRSEEYTIYTIYNKDVYFINNIIYILFLIQIFNKKIKIIKGWKWCYRFQCKRWKNR